MASEPSGTKTRSVITEVGVFAVFMGVFLGIGSYLTLTGLQSAPPVAGVARSIVFGVPMALMAAVNLACGIFVLVARSKAAIVSCIVAGGAVAVFYLAFEILFMGYPFAGRLISVVAYAIPVMLVIRGFKAMAECEAEAWKKRREGQGAPQEEA
ncbi:MAG TPA: hypothetical protein PK280_03895 [Planctomycetota bacterium]|nr:hypothetical protein [Planctomycetota bacterium]